jgi:cell division protein FtsB
VGRTGATRSEFGVVLRPTRLLALAALVAVGFLYWKPILAYEHTAAQLRTRQQQVDALSSEARDLEARIDSVVSGPGFVREARRLGFVKPGQQLFIVRGIAAWRKHH